MNIYSAILKAADHIERYPSEFRWMSCLVPSGRGCGTPGCAIGWIAHFAGYTDHGFHQFCRDWMKISGHYEHSDSIFYGRMRDIGDGPKWKKDADECARVLRLYAEKYHGHERPKPVEVPNWTAIATLPAIPDAVKSEDACHV